MIHFSKIKNHPAYKTQKEMTAHYKELYDIALKIANENKVKGEQYKKDWEDTQLLLNAGVGELRFANIQNAILIGEIESIASYTNDILVKKQIELVKERYNLDKLIHARILFK